MQLCAVVAQHTAVQAVLIGVEVGAEALQALADQAQRFVMLAQMVLDEGETVLVEDRVDRPFLDAGQQRRDSDGLVDPAERAAMVTPLLVIVASAEHGDAIGSPHMHQGGGTDSAGLLVKLLGLGRTSEGRQGAGTFMVKTHHSSC